MDAQFLTQALTLARHVPPPPTLPPSSLVVTERQAVVDAWGGRRTEPLIRYLAVLTVIERGKVIGPEYAVCWHALAHAYDALATHTNDVQAASTYELAAARATSLATQAYGSMPLPWTPDLPHVLRVQAEAMRLFAAGASARHIAQVYERALVKTPLDPYLKVGEAHWRSCALLHTAPALLTEVEKAKFTPDHIRSTYARRERHLGAALTVMEDAERASTLSVELRRALEERMKQLQTLHKEMQHVHGAYCAAIGDYIFHESGKLPDLLPFPPLTTLPAVMDEKNYFDLDKAVLQHADAYSITTPSVAAKVEDRSLEKILARILPGQSSRAMRDPRVQRAALVALLTERLQRLERGEVDGVYRNKLMESVKEKLGLLKM